MQTSFDLYPDQQFSHVSEESPIRILGIETSCDETAASVVEDGRVILSSAVASQSDLHAKYGGVFPEVASRQHIITIRPIIEQALRDAHMDLKEVDAVAVTRGPGLPGSLVVGINMAKGLALGSNLPLLGINHLEGHLYSAWLYKSDAIVNQSTDDMATEPRFPLLGLVVSGGHTELILMRDHLTYDRLGGTLDDAAGEAFDKVGRMLGLKYPGGPEIERSAADGDPNRYQFPRAWLEGSWNFSFSGLKTAVLRTIRRIEQRDQILPVSDIAASFQASVVDVLVGKTLKAAEEYQAEEILIVGGVSANKSLRKSLRDQAYLPIHLPPIELCTDNAAMIAGAGYYRFISGHRDTFDMDALPTWPLFEL
jgi:N6-L-threonylcarbamoyladenine synthase